MKLRLVVALAIFSKGLSCKTSAKQQKFSCHQKTQFLGSVLYIAAHPDDKILDSLRTFLITLTQEQHIYH